MTTMKGVRKTARRRPSSIKIGRFELSPELVVSGLLALIYVLFVFGGSVAGSDIMIQLVYYALFGVMIFMLRAGQRYYTKLGYAFLVIATPPMLWQVARYLGYGPATPDLAWLLWVGIVSFVLGAGLVAGLLYFEKGKLSEIFVQAGDLRESVRFGATTLAVAIVLTIAYVVFRSGVGLSEALPGLGCLAVFSIGCAVGEELLFRGLLLSRLLPMVKEPAALGFQTLAFAAFEAALVYMLAPDVLYSAALFVVAGIAGLLLGWMTLKNKSLLSPIMAHTGLYLVIALPIFAQLF